MIRSLARRLAAPGLVRDSGLTFVLYGLTLMVNLLTGVLIARTLGADGRGALTAIITVPQMLAFIFAIGVSQAVAYRLAREPSAGGRLLTTWTVILLPLAALALAVGFLLLPVLLGAQSEHTHALAQLFLVTVVLGLADELTSGFLLGDHDFLFFNLRRLAQPTLMGIGFLALWGADRLTVDSALAVTAAALVLTSAAGIVRILSRHRPRPGSQALGREQIWYGVRAYTSGLGQTVNARLDLLIMPAILTASAVGSYSVATNLAFIVATLGGTLAQIVLPAAARQGAGGTRTVILSLYATLGVSVAMAAVLAAAAEIGVRTIYGPEFADSVLPLRILLPGCVLFAAAAVLWSGLNAANRPFTAAAAQVGGIVVTIVGLLIFLRSGGIVAAAIISTVSYALVFAASAFLYRRALHLEWRDFLPRRSAAGRPAGPEPQGV